ncbi:hypothetical protein Tco_0195582 [Tanacetum coccineum]
MELKVLVIDGDNSAKESLNGLFARKGLSRVQVKWCIGQGLVFVLYFVYIDVVSSGWSFVYAILGQMTYPVASPTLDSAGSYGNPLMKTYSLHRVLGTHVWDKTANLGFPLSCLFKRLRKLAISKELLDGSLTSRGYGMIHNDGDGDNDAYDDDKDDDERDINNVVEEEKRWVMEFAFRVIINSSGNKEKSGDQIVNEGGKYQRWSHNSGGV